MATEKTITEEITAKMVASQPLNWEKAQAIGAEFDVKPRAIVASAKRQGLDYKRQVRVTKSGNPVVSKTDLVAQIAEKSGLELADLDGLEKATKTALEAIVKAF